MELMNSIKRAPRWAWVTAAGIGLGAAGIKLWTNRAKEDSPADAEVMGEDGVLASGQAYSNNPVATIVPPVILNGNTADANQGVGVLQDLYVGAVGNLMDSWESVWGPVQTAQLALLTGNAQTIQDLAIAGAAPQSNTPPPPQIVPFPVPVAQAPPITLPAPAPAPAPPAPAPSRPASPCGSCKAPYPYCNEANGACYTVACATGKGEKRKGKWHLYANRPDVYMGSQC